MAETRDRSPPPDGLGVWQEIRKEVCLDPASTKPDKIIRPSDDYRNIYHAYETVGIMSPDEPEEQRHWVIGSYTELRTLAGHLRVKTSVLPDFDKSCYGRRHNDKAPAGAYKRPAAFATDEQEAEKRERQGLAPTRPQHVLNPRDPSLIGQRADPTSTEQRATDRFKPRADYYKAKTLEAHHIVEKSILGTLGINKNELSNNAAPCVLLASEMHQQLFTRQVNASRDRFTPGMSNDKAAAALEKVYDEVYDPDEFAALKKIAMIIINRVRHGRTD